MLNEQELIAYLENALPPTERQRVEAELERDPKLRRQLLQQSQMEHALRATLGDTERNERVKQSVLAVLRGEQEESLKRRVLADAAQPTSILDLLSTLVRRPAFAFALAACLCLFAGVWFFNQRDSNTPAPLSLAVETPVLVQLPSGTVTPKSGDTIRVNNSGSGTVAFADGTVLHLEPGTEISFQTVAKPPHPGGKQLKLLAGSLSASVAKQPPNLPLLIQTPHALVTVVGTEFDLNVATNQTALEVTHGLVKMTISGETNPVNVAAGEFAVAAPKRPLQYGRLARNPYLWPFSSSSPWNTPLGDGAKFSPVPGKPFLADGPLTGAMRGRRPFLGSPNDPLRRIWVNGEVRADVRLAQTVLPEARGADAIVLLQHGRRYALEVRGVTFRADGDLEATDMERIRLDGSGITPHAIPALPFGLSSLGGLLRSGELENGIRHALAARVSRDRLAGRDFSHPATLWPAADAAPDQDAKQLCVGTLLAIPPGVNIAAKFGTNGPAHELARAMQDYGVYITGYIDAPFVLLADNAGPANADEILTQLVPLLQIVTNNSPASTGQPRREPAPAFPEESK